jgi:hypothetical protein
MRRLRWHSCSIACPDGLSYSLSRLRLWYEKFAQQSYLPHYQPIGKRALFPVNVKALSNWWRVSTQLDKASCSLSLVPHGLTGNFPRSWPCWGRKRQTGAEVAGGELGGRGGIDGMWKHVVRQSVSTNALAFPPSLQYREVLTSKSIASSICGISFE